MRCGRGSGALTALSFVLACIAPGIANEVPLDGTQAHISREVWRLSGRVLSSDGRAFAYAVSFFRFTQARGPTLVPAAMSIVDESAGRRIAERRTERDALGLAGVSREPLAIHVGDWSLRESASHDRTQTFDLQVRFAGGSLALHGIALKPKIAFDDDHDAYTSIASSGTLALGTDRLLVRGKSWLDRESDDAAAAPRLGTHVDRYRVALDDGREIFVESSSAPGARTPERRAFLIRRDGTLETLVPSHYEFASHGGATWRSTHTSAHYPALWALHVDDETEYLSLEPVIRDQEAIADGNGAPFWDGAVDVYDVTPSSEGRRLGSGFVLLAGYDTAGRR